jgi:hypothetical protein
MNDTMSIVWRAMPLQRLQLGRLEHHVAVLLELVALDHLGALDRHVSLMHRYCCFTREPQVCSRLKLTPPALSVAEYSFTGSTRARS